MTESTAKIYNDGDVQKEEGDLIFDPFNPQNREITLKEVQNILETYVNLDLDPNSSNYIGKRIGDMKMTIRTDENGNPFLQPSGSNPKA